MPVALALALPALVLVLVFVGSLALALVSAKITLPTLDFGRLIAPPTRTGSPAFVVAMVSVRDGEEPRENSRRLVSVVAWLAGVAARIGE